MDVAARFAALIETLCGAVAARGAKGAFGAANGALVVLLWSRLRRAVRRFAILAAGAPRAHVIGRRGLPPSSCPAAPPGCSPRCPRPAPSPAGCATCSKPRKPAPSSRPNRAPAACFARSAARSASGCPPACVCRPDRGPPSRPPKLAPLRRLPPRRIPRRRRACRPAGPSGPARFTPARRRSRPDRLQVAAIPPRSPDIAAKPPPGCIPRGAARIRLPGRNAARSVVRPAEARAAGRPILPGIGVR